MAFYITPKESCDMDGKLCKGKPSILGRKAGFSLEGMLTIERKAWGY
jgi:hypothetical protein